MEENKIETEALLNKFNVLAHIILTEGLKDKRILEKVSIDTMREELKAFGIELDFKDIYSFFLTLGQLKEYATTISAANPKK